MAKSRKSSLSKKTNARRNTKAGRKKMSPSQFALPGKKKYRLDDAAHARNALARVEQHGTATEKKQVKAKVRKRYPSIAVGGKKKTTTRRRKK
jgi:hypothetical protein